MPIYRFRVSGEVEVEAPNIAQAWRYVRKAGRMHEVARVSAGSGTSCPGRPSGRNIHWPWVSARSVGGTKRVEYLETPNVRVEPDPTARRNL